MTKDQRLKAAEAYAQKLDKFTNLDTHAFSNRDVNDIVSDTANKAFLAGAEAEAESKWVSVDDRLPEIHERVTILEWTDGLSEPSVLQGSYEINRWRIYGGKTAEKVTHWCQLPTPPLNQQ